MLKFSTPSRSYLEQKIRDIGTTTLPRSNNFWFEDIEQIPARIAKQPYLVETDQLGETHELWLNNQLQQKFRPSERTTTLWLALSPKIYDYEIRNSKQFIRGSFQISNKEFLWWLWAQALTSPFQDLTAIESRFKSPINLMLFEISYPVDLSSIRSTPYTMRAFAQASHVQGQKQAVLALATAVFNNNVKAYIVAYQLTDIAEKFSKITIPMLDSTAARRGSFLEQQNQVVVEEAQWSVAKISSTTETRTFETLDVGFGCKFAVENFQFDTRRCNAGNFVFQIVAASGEIISTLEFVREFKQIQYFQSPYFEHPGGSIYLKVLLSNSAKTLYEPKNLIKLLLAPKESATLRLDWVEKLTKIKINAPPNANWVITGFNSPLPNLFIEAGQGTQTISVEGAFLQGYRQFGIVADSISGYITPAPTTITINWKDTRIVYLTYREV